MAASTENGRGSRVVYTLAIGSVGIFVSYCVPSLTGRKGLIAGERHLGRNQRDERWDSPRCCPRILVGGQKTYFERPESAAKAPYDEPEIE